MKKLIALFLLASLGVADAQTNPGVPSGGGSGGGGGGGAATIANGADVAEGSTTDGPCAAPATTAACTAIAVMKAIQNGVNAPTPAGTNLIGGVNNAQWSGVALGAPSNYGTSPGAVAVPGTNAFITNAPNVVNAGTFAVQNTAATPAGSNIIGNVRIDQTTPGTTNGVVLNTGANTIGALTANQSVNNAQVSGTAIAVNNGVSSTGTQRVNIASDNSPIAVGHAPATSTLATAAPTAGTFSSLLASSATRKACFIQNTGTTLGYVYPAASGGTTANAFQIAAGGSFNCVNGNIVITDAITGTCASGTCAFVISSQ